MPIRVPQVRGTLTPSTARRRRHWGGATIDEIGLGRVGIIHFKTEFEPGCGFRRGVDFNP